MPMGVYAALSTGIVLTDVVGIYDVYTPADTTTVNMYTPLDTPEDSAQVCVCAVLMAMIVWPIKGTGRIRKPSTMYKLAIYPRLPIHENKKLSDIARN